MAATASTMLPLGTPMPAFQLPDYGINGSRGGVTVTHDPAGAPATVVMFICNHCPFVHHIQPELVRLAHDYAGRGVRFVAVSSNDIETHPDDAPHKMSEVAGNLGYPFPYLYDESQEVAKAFRAACTPDFYVFDKDNALAYRGQLDGSRPSNGQTVTGADLRAALDAVLDGTDPAEPHAPSMGCNIKWKRGNEPDYFG
ncbi:MAG: thioredoxin family protein [Planctomycetota bacterium]